MGKRKRSISILAGFFVLLAALAITKPAVVSAKTYNITLKTKKNKDITEELQEALDKAKSGKHKVNITIKKGTYKLSKMLSMYSNTTISMKGVTLKRTASKNNEVMLRLGKSADKKSGYNGYKKITIKGGTFDGGGRKGGIIRLGHAKNITLDGVTFTNVKNSHFVEIAACSDITINKCKFTKYVGSRKESLEALQIDILDADHFSGYAKYDETPCKNITVKGCTFKDLSRAAGTHNAYVGSCHTNIQFLNNVFTDITGYAITTFNYQGAVIKGNKIESCGAGIVFRTMNKADKALYVPSTAAAGCPSSSSVISDNTITLNYTSYLKGHPGYKDMVAGVWLSGDVLETDEEFEKGTVIPAGDYTVRDVTVQNNTITLGMRGLAICLYGANGNRILDNKITCNITAKGFSTDEKGAGAGDGIRLAGSSSNMIQKNTITNKTAAGPAKDMNGISLADGSGGNVLQENEISGTSKHGIVVKGEGAEHNTLEGNKIRDIRLAAGMGISLEEGSHYTTLRMNQISNLPAASQAGICVANATSNVGVYNNTVSKGGKYGIIVKDGSSDVTLQGNKIFNSGENGILVANAQRVRVETNVIKNSGQYGLLVKDNASVTASGNSISGSGKKDMMSGVGSTIN